MHIRIFSFRHVALKFMRILLIKTSSLGDIIHSFPAVSDALRENPDISVDWVVEESFAELFKLYQHPVHVVTIALRRWRKHWYRRLTWQQIRQFRKTIGTRHYDMVIDAQGLLKSACLTLGTGLYRSGMDRHSCREPWAACFYHKTFPVNKNQHAVLRVRELMAKALHYKLSQDQPDYGIRPLPAQSYTDTDAEPLSVQPAVQPVQSIQSASVVTPTRPKPYVFLLHGTTWPEKLWPVRYWQKLAERITAQGMQVQLTWGSVKEHGDAQIIAKDNPDIHIVNKSSLIQLASMIHQAKAIVAVDTGLAHLAAAMNKPCISLYLATSPLLTGCYGSHQVHLAIRGQETPYIKKQLSQHINTPVSPVYLDQEPDDQLVYQYLQPYLA